MTGSEQNGNGALHGPALRNRRAVAAG